MRLSSRPFSGDLSPFAEALLRLLRVEVSLPEGYQDSAFPHPKMKELPFDRSYVRVLFSFFPFPIGTFQLFFLFLTNAVQDLDI